MGAGPPLGPPSGNLDPWPNFEPADREQGSGNTGAGACDAAELRVLLEVMKSRPYAHHAAWAKHTQPLYLAQQMAAAAMAKASN